MLNTLHECFTLKHWSSKRCSCCTDLPAYYSYVANIVRRYLRTQLLEQRASFVRCYWSEKSSQGNTVVACNCKYVTRKICHKYVIISISFFLSFFVGRTFRPTWIQILPTIYLLTITSTFRIIVVITNFSLASSFRRPPLWSSGQSFWLQIQRSRVRFPALPDFSE